MANKATLDWRQALFLLLALVAMYVVIPQIGRFRESLTILRNADIATVFAAAALIICTYLAAAGTYYFLTSRRLHYARTLLIQTAGALVNHLLPAGIGGIGINFLYLHRAGYNKTEAASIVTVNNALGFAGHGLLLVVLLAAYGQQLPPLAFWRLPDSWVITCITVIAVLVWSWLYHRYGRQIINTSRDFADQLLSYQRRLRSLFAALACSMTLTLLNVASLWLCIQAVGGNAPFIAVFLVFTFGIALGTATPTPGGLGGIEAGLVAGLAVYQVETTVALAAVLIYRLLSYWLPMIAGSVAFIYSQRRHYI